MDAGERWIAVARLLRPQGRRGEILADPLTDLDVFITGRELHLAVGSEYVSGATAVILEDAWKPQGRNAARIVLKLAGTDSISTAEALEGRHLFLPEKDLPALEDGTFMVRDLVGCSLWSDGRSLGVVTDVQFPVGPDGRTRLHDAPDLLVIEPAEVPSTEEDESVLVPFVKAWLQSVDLEGKRIVMNIPAGLFDDSAELLPEDEEP